MRSLGGVGLKSRWSTPRDLRTANSTGKYSDGFSRLKHIGSLRATGGFVMNLGRPDGFREAECSKKGFISTTSPVLPVSYRNMSHFSM